MNSLNKNLIKQRFTKSLKTYNDNAKIQSLMAEKLVSIPNKKNFNNILEIGCGTGLLTQNIINNYNFETYTANDIVPECQNYIKQISNKINFINQDMEEFIYNNNNKYDLIISNAAFQWVDNFKPFFEAMYNKLTSDGILLFSVFGENNFKEIFEITGKKLNYKSLKYYKELFENKNAHIEANEYNLVFETPLDVLRHLKRTGVNAISMEQWTKKDITQFQDKYKKISKSGFNLTYNPIFVYINKNKK